MRRAAFTLVELLVVVALVSALLAILMPAAGRVRLQGRLVAVNAELRQIGLALEMYTDEHDGQAPPTRKDCSLGWEDHQLPPELVAGGYLPPPSAGSGMSAGIGDRFQPGHTYKYWAVGPLIQNGLPAVDRRASLYVPPGFPDSEGPAEQDRLVDDPRTSPVTWVVASVGPRHDAWEAFKVLHGPVPRRSWYDPARARGLVVRLRLHNGRHIGSFEAGRPPRAVANPTTGPAGTAAATGP